MLLLNKRKLLVGSSSLLLFNRGAAQSNSAPEPILLGSSNKITVPNGLVGYWPLNEGGGTLARDISGNGNNGSYVASPLWGAAPGGLGVVLNGSTQYINVGATSFTFSKTTPFSGVIGFKGTSTSTTLMANFNYPNSPGWQFAAGTVVNFAMSNANFTSARIVNGSTTVSDGQFHCAAFTYDGSNIAAGINLVVDGNPEALTITSNSDPGAFVSGHFTIGVNTATFFTGTEFFARMYDRKLYVDEAIRITKAALAGRR